MLLSLLVPPHTAASRFSFPNNTSFHSPIPGLASATPAGWRRPPSPFPITRRTTTAGAAESKKKKRMMSPRALYSSSPSPSEAGKMQAEEEPAERGVGGKSFWAAVSLIIGTAVGPGMLGLPSATIRAGPLPSTLAIVLSWIYVVSSILLVAELSFGLMEANGVEEVSFTSLAAYALGTTSGWLVGLVYASLNFALLVACISGIGSIVSQWIPYLPPLVANAIFPFTVGCIIGFCPFDVIDSANRVLCLLMLLSIVSLVVIGLSVGRSSLLNSLSHASWSFKAILPAVPVTVLTLGFHVITPFVCKVVRTSAYDAAKAVLLGGVIPLLMVLSWNLVVLGFVSATYACTYQQRPIEFLLSVNAAALPAVQAFAFSALATSLIGYALGFPKQLLDMLEMTKSRSSVMTLSSSVENQQAECDHLGSSLLGSVSSGITSSSLQATLDSDKIHPLTKLLSSKSSSPLMMIVVLGVPVVIATFFREAFSAALDYAGVYANCFLFGVLPPLMVWNHRSRLNNRSTDPARVVLLPGGQISLILLFSIAVFLGVWH